jgi:large subunit ribosomal protein L17
MNHGNRVNHLGRTASHRKALMANMASSLILHKRIRTTVAKAKELRKFVEPLITKAKSDTTHSRRVVFGYLKFKQPVKELFTEVAPKVADRPGGYTRIIRLENRLGDNAEMCVMELVDYNETYSNNKKAATSKTRRKRAKKGAGATEAVAETAAKPKKAKPAAEPKTEAAPAAEAESTTEPENTNEAENTGEENQATE